MSDQPYMIFEIKEKVKHFKDGQSFQALTSLELEPIVKVYESTDEIEVAGYLVLTGEFLSKDMKHLEEDFEQSDGIHYTSFFGNDGEMETFQYQIPVSFTIKPDRVNDVSNLLILVEDFDYDVISEKEMDIIANVKLLGVHPEPKQDRPANSHSDYFSEHFSYPEGDMLHSDDFDYSRFDEEQNIQSDTELGSPYTNMYKKTKDYQKEIPEQKAESEVVTEMVQETEPSNEMELEEEKTNEELGRIEDKGKQEEEKSSFVKEEGINDIVQQPEEENTKVKIGIKGKNKDVVEKKEVKKEDKKEEKKSSSLLYSLLKKDKNKANEENKELQKELDHSAVGPVTEDNTAENIVNREVEESLGVLESSSESNKVVSMEEYVKDKESIVNNEIDETEEEEFASKTVSSRGTKDMLFSLLQDNEENMYKLKIYFVQKEDTLDLIADKYNVKVTDLLRYNRMETGEVIEGQMIYLPTKR